MRTFYGYAKCSTCRKAKAYLLARGIACKEIDITIAPPPKAVLAGILRTGRYTIQDLFNRSGELYRSLKMKEKIKTMSHEALLELLARHGKLIKRPIVTDGKCTTVGFDEAVMRAVWG